MALTAAPIANCAWESGAPDSALSVARRAARCAAQAGCHDVVKCGDNALSQFYEDAVSRVALIASGPAAANNPLLNEGRGKASPKSR